MTPIFLALLAQAAAPASVPGTPLTAIGRQALPAKGCAAYLWSLGTERALVAMAVADPAQLRLSIDGTTRDYARIGQSGEGGFGFAGMTTYRAGDVTATLDLTVATRVDLTKGASVPEATLRIERVGRDLVVVPVAGLIGCAG